MELIIICKCNPSEEDGWWSCPDEEVLKQQSCNAEQRFGSTEKQQVSSWRFPHFDNLCAAAAGKEGAALLFSSLLLVSFQVKPAQRSTGGHLACLPRRTDPERPIQVRVCVRARKWTPRPHIPSGKVNGHAPALTCGLISIFSFCFRCTRPCRFRSSLRAKRLPHTSQENGFSPV